MANTEHERDPSGRAFAQLTAELEDATSPAVLGQDRDASIRKHLRLTARIQQRVTTVGSVLNRIEGALRREGGGSA